MKAINVLVGIIFILLLTGCKEIPSEKISHPSGKIVFRGIDRSDTESLPQLYAISWKNGKSQTAKLSPDGIVVKNLFHNKQPLMYSFSSEAGKTKITYLSPTSTPEYTSSLIPDHGSLSPDGNIILFASSENKPRVNKSKIPLSDIFLLDIKANKLTRITDKGHNVGPSWSPDGKRIAFYQLDEQEAGNEEGDKEAPGFALMVMDSDGSNLRQLAAPGYLINLYWQQIPAWSPDGTQIAFITKPDIQEQPGLYTVELSQNKISLISAKAGYPAWSPDGTEMAYSSFFGREGSELHTRILNTDKDILLASKPGFHEKAFWSPDGNHLGFISDGRLFVVDRKGNNRGQVSPENIVIQDQKSELFWLPDDTLSK